ncbi:MAG: riboflavin synthase [Candidatus Gracilibacteria bacterium]
MMFTGLIQSIGKINRLETTKTGLRMTLCASFSKKIKPGDSIAVNGVCLTVIAPPNKAKMVSFDVMPETLKTTTLGFLKKSDFVNLESALCVGDALGGHFVQGHVDGVGMVQRIVAQNKEFRVWISLPRSLQRYVAKKGSIAIDGVSLTVSDVKKSPASFEVCLIPHTLANTTLFNFKKGTRVNLEIDLLARYLGQLLKK